MLYPRACRANQLHTLHMMESPKQQNFLMHIRTDCTERDWGTGYLKNTFHKKTFFYVWCSLRLLSLSSPSVLLGAYVSPCHGNTTRVWPTTFPLRILRLARDSSSSKCPLHALVGGKAPNLRLWSTLYCFASAHFLACHSLRRIERVTVDNINLT